MSDEINLQLDSSLRLVNTNTSTYSCGTECYGLYQTAINRCTRNWMIANAAAVTSAFFSFGTGTIIVLAVSGTVYII